MKITNTDISGCFLISSDKFTDNRGFFSRIYCDKELKNIFSGKSIVQINLSQNIKKGTFRGMHLLKPPSYEDKYIRCISGSVYDIILDLRENSPTFLMWQAFELSDLNNIMIFIPKGVAHGFQTLENNTQLLYHHTDYFNKENDFGINYNDPLLDLRLPLEISEVSEKDLNYKLLPNNFKGFNYDM